jgi:hypothetical protein
MPANLSFRTELDKLCYKPGSKVHEAYLLHLINYCPKLASAILPPTPDEILTGVEYISGVIKDQGDYPKAIAIVSNKVEGKANQPVFVEKIMSPSTSIGFSQIIIDGVKKYVVIFKNKQDLMGFACIGGTLAAMTPNCGPLTQEERAVAYKTALEREFLEEAGIQVDDCLLIDAPQINARLDHSCAFYLVKGSMVGEQRLEDSDLSVLVTDFETAVLAMTCYLAIDDFVVRYFRFHLQEIRNYFGE